PTSPTTPPGWTGPNTPTKAGTATQPSATSNAAIGTSPATSTPPPPSQSGLFSKPPSSVSPESTSPPPAPSPSPSSPASSSPRTSHGPHQDHRHLSPSRHPLARLGARRIPPPPFPSSQPALRRARRCHLAQLLSLPRPSSLPSRLPLPLRRQQLLKPHPLQCPL